MMYELGHKHEEELPSKQLQSTSTLLQKQCLNSDN